jgi:hypothetical protein
MHLPIQTPNMINMKKIVLLVSLLIALTRLPAQTVSFSFSADSTTTPGWINVYGDPAVATVTAAGPSGISISSVSPAYWAGYAGSSAADGYGATGGTFFPASVMVNNWWQYSGGGTLGAYNAAVPQLIISGLNRDSVYTIKMSSSSTTGFNTNPTRYTVIGAAVVGYQDVNTHNNTASGAVFVNVAPNSSGQVSVYVNTVSGTEAANISGLQIISGRTTAPTPQVTITSPANNDILAEDGNIIINATASETGGTITKVEFYNDTTKLGESLSSPYSFTWTNPNEGHYRIVARAIDGTGNANSASIQVSVESLSSFWSMTGNIAMNPDSNFVGNVDSVRLGFRTKNIERVSISPTGNVGIGTINPSAQLHTTGTVRLAGLTGDSTKNRVLVSDTSGNLFYRNVSSLSNRWQFAGTTVFDSADNIAIGTSTVPTGYKLAVNGTAIFTKVRVKTAGTWPDYVFKKGYALPDLNQLERYIAAHQHLPGIVSEAEANKDGVDVGDHQAALLQKIEELTLYVIEQNKTLKAQQQEIDELKKLVRKGK